MTSCSSGLTLSDLALLKELDLLMIQLSQYFEVASTEYTNSNIIIYMLDMAGNYRNYGKYKHTSWKCQACNLDVIEDQEHLIVCDGYADLHQGADLRMEPELVDFYQRVLNRRKEKNWT